MEALPKYTITTIEPNIHHLHIPDTYDLAMTVCRASEVVESPEFHQKCFSIEEYMRWYSKAYGNGSFTYPIDWAGFNLTSSAIHATYKMNQRGGKYIFSDLERILFEELKRCEIYDPQTPIKASFSLICTSKYDTRTTFRHELAHGRWHTNEEYREEMQEGVHSFSAHTKSLAEWLKREGYQESVIEDEIHAYALTGWPEDFKPSKGLLTLRKALLASRSRLLRENIIEFSS